MKKASLILLLVCAASAIAQSPSNVNGLAFNATISSGVPPLAPTGSFRLEIGADGLIYSVKRITGPVAASQGVFGYSKTGPNTARISVFVGGIGTTLTGEFTFDTRTAGSFSLVTSVGGGRQNGTFVLIGLPPAPPAPPPASLPSLALQPLSQTLQVGATVQFSVSATGTAPLRYQWQFNGQNIGGATGTNYVISNVQEFNQGSYRAIVSNGQGSVTSQTATLTVQERKNPPVISEQPQNMTVIEGSRVELRIGTSGSPPFTYQWWFNGGVLSNETGSTILYNPVGFLQAGTYQVVVSNAVGSANSAPFTVTVQERVDPPIIENGIKDQTLRVGGDVSFSVTVTGKEPISYEWRFDGNTIPGEIDSILNIRNVSMDAVGNYEVVATNAGGSIMSGPAHLVVFSGRVLDFNGDMNSDIFFMRNDGALAVWMMDGVRQISGSVLEPDNLGSSDWKVEAVADLDRDLKPDLVLRKTDGSLGAWLMDGLTLKRSVLFTPERMADPTSSVVGLGDFNSDGSVDLLLQNGDGEMSVWFMNGTVRTGEALVEPPIIDNVDWHLISVGEFNNDGNADLVLQNTDGTVGIWFLVGTTRSSAVIIESDGDHSALWEVVETSDFNNDGNSDLLFQHSDGSLKVWFLADATRIGSESIEPVGPGPEWRVNGRQPRLTSSNVEAASLAVLSFSANTMLLSVTGTSGATYVIQSSTDLKEWNQLGSVTLQSTRGNFADPRDAVFQRQFYRAIPSGL